MKLGRLLDVLERINPKDWIWIADVPVRMVPTTLDSYRGYYDQLALGVEPSHDVVQAGDLYASGKAALDIVYTGYKGGSYRMGLDTEVWLSNCGEASGARITGVREIAGVGAWEITWEKDKS